MIKKTLLFITSILLFLSCAKKNQEEQAKIDDEIISTYLSKNNITAIKSESGLYYSFDEEGDQKRKPTSNSQVKVAYKGYLSNNEVFDESNSDGIVFGLNQVIEGWTEGITYFGEGGSGKLFIPSSLGYGNKATGSIPANSVLIFEIHLIEVY